MGDRRFERVYRSIERATDRAAAIRDLTDEDVVAAVAQASTERDPYLLNILATEAANRMRRATIITEHLGEGVVAFDTNGVVAFANHAAHRMLGWSRGELVGQALDRTIMPGGAHAKLLHVLEDPYDVDESQCEFATRDGRRVPSLCTTVPILRDGTATGAVVVFRDITERLRAEQALLEQRALYELLLQGLADLGQIVLLVEGARLIYANEAMARVSGYTVDELATLPSLLDLVPPGERDSLIRLASASIAGTREPFHVAIQRKDGTPLHVQAVAKRVTFEGRAVVVALLRERAREAPRA